MSDFRERLRDARLAAGLRQRELAERAELSSEFVSQIERGIRQPSPFAAKVLADKLGVHFAWLLKGEGPRELAGRIDDLVSSTSALERRIEDSVKAYQDDFRALLPHDDARRNFDQLLGHMELLRDVREQHAKARLLHAQQHGSHLAASTEPTPEAPKPPSPEAAPKRKPRKSR